MAKQATTTTATGSHRRVGACRTPATAHQIIRLVLSDRELGRRCRNRRGPAAAAQGVQQTYPITLIAETTKGCKDTVIKNVDVYPKVTAQFNSDTAGCSPFDVDFAVNFEVDVESIWSSKINYFERLKI